MGFTKFKLLGERVKSGLGLDKTYFPFYDNSSDADFRVSMRTMISFIGDYISGGSQNLTSVLTQGNSAGTLRIINAGYGVDP